MAIKLKDLEIFSDSLGNNFGGNAGSSGGAFNFLGGVIPNIANIANIVTQQQQGPVLGPDDFGSYTIPVSDPTYRSGFDYARSIAGGMPMSQVIAPGVSYSPEQPMGYTQEQLNTPVGTTPVEPPPPPPEKLPAPDEPGYGQGIGGVTIFDDVFDRKRMPPLRDIFGGKPDMRTEIRPLENLMNLGKLFGGGIDKDAIDKIVQERIAESMPTIEQPDFSQFVRREDIPSLIPEVPTGREFSIEDIRSGLDLPDFTKFARQEDIPSIPTFVQPDLTGFARLEDIPQIPTFDREALIEDIRSGIDIPQPPSIDREALIKDITGRIDLPKPPSIDRQALIEDIRSGIELPSYKAPDLSSFARLEDIPTFDPTGLQEQITALQQRPGFDPTSIQQDISQLQTRPQFDPTGLQEQISGLQQQIGGIPQFDPTTLQQQIAANQAAIAGIDIPTFQAPDFSPYETRIAELEQQIAGLQVPTGGRFSVDRQSPIGLF